MKTRTTLLLIAFCMAALGCKHETAPTTSGTAEAAVEAGPSCAIAPFELHLTGSHSKVEGDNTVTTETVTVITVDAAGAISVGGETLGTVSEECALSMGDEAHTLTLDKAGNVSVHGADIDNSEVKPAVIDDSGQLWVDGVAVLSIGDDGTISMSGDTNSAAYKGPPEARKAALLVLVGTLMPATSESASESSNSSSSSSSSSSSDQREKAEEVGLEPMPTIEEAPADGE